MTQRLELGLDTFGDVTEDADGTILPHAQVIRDVVEEAMLADRLGLDAFGIGEHHREDFAISAPEPVLAAIAARTSRLKLASAVTVLSSDDPIRVHQRFATLDALSAGRAEVILGRGSFTESFPLFGHALADYERLFEEKLDLFAAVRAGGSVTWQGSVRPPLNGQTVYPPVERGPLKAWVGVGGSPDSIVRAVRHDLPMMLAIIGGAPLRFRPHVDLYARTCAELGRAVRPIGVHSPGHVAESDAAARDTFWPAFKAMHDRIGRERRWPPLTRDGYEKEIDQGSLYVGSPGTVAAKIASTARGLGLSRFALKYSAGALPHSAMMRCIDLYGREVAPRVHTILSPP